MRQIGAMSLGVAVLALALGCSKSSNTTGSGTPPAAASIEGTWLLVGMEASGEPFPEEIFTKGKEEDRITKITADKFGGKGDPIDYKVDTSKTPHQIDLTGKDKKGKEEKSYGIYKLEGDTLTIVMTEPGKTADRPKEFKTAKGDKTMMMTFKRK